MNSYVAQLLSAYFNLLDGNITYSGNPVKIYNVGVDATDTFHYIQLRPESEPNSSNKSNFVTNPIIVADICTFHDGSIDASVVEDIDNQMRQLLFPTRQGIIIETNDYQITNIKSDGSAWLEGFNGVRHEHRKITRFNNTIIQRIN